MRSSTSATVAPVGGSPCPAAVMRRVIAEMHYREAAELAYYGAKVLHPRTMIPLVDRKIPLLVRNTFRETSAGTRIAGDVKPGAYPVKALTAIHRQALISIEGSTGFSLM